jgi:hypothetical protein
MRENRRPDNPALKEQLAIAFWEAKLTELQSFI